MEALPKWRAWLCTQTKQTYQQICQDMPLADVGGMSNAMSLRCAAAYGYFRDEEDVAHAARTMMFTHREATALDGGEFFARVSFRIIHKGMSPKEAITEVAGESSQFIQEKVKQALDKVAEATDSEQALSREGDYVDDKALTSMARLWDVGRSEPIKVGKASPTEGVLPGSIYFIVKYGDLFEAAKANAMVGGDSASRGVCIGMVLGSHQGMEGVPQHLKDTFVDWARLDSLLDDLPLIKAASGPDGLGEIKVSKRAATGGYAASQPQKAEDLTAQQRAALFMD
jgi:ADP-ribosylglycohydrolase